VQDDGCALLGEFDAERGKDLNMRFTASRWIIAGFPGRAVNLNLTSSALSMMSATPCILKGARISDLMAEPIAPPAASSAATLLLRQVIAQWRAV